MLRDKFKAKPNVDIVKLHKSGGVVARSSKFRQRMRNVKTRVSLACLIFFERFFKQPAFFQNLIMG